jgi:hypothetical protein
LSARPASGTSARNQLEHWRLVNIHPLAVLDELPESLRVGPAMILAGDERVRATRHASLNEGDRESLEEAVAPFARQSLDELPRPKSTNARSGYAGP